MCYDLIKEKAVTCRKRHRCAWCDEAIFVGDKANYRCYKIDSDFTDDYMHPECADACKEMGRQEGSFQFDPGEFKRGTMQSVNDDESSWMPL